ncbi:MAG TPA: hypothetical protein VIQ79_22455, partial [Kribbella sp.]
MAGAVDQAGRDTPDRLAYSGPLAGQVGPELVPAQPEGQQSRRQVDGGRRTEDYQVGVGDQFHAGPDATADQEQRSARGRRDRVRHHELVGVDHVRQTRGQPGQQEAVHPEGQQHGQVERESSVADGNNRADHQDQRRPGQVRPEEDLPPGPPVEEYPGERAEHGVRQQR